jgi:hypothetical protein
MSWKGTPILVSFFITHCRDMADNAEPNLHGVAKTALSRLHVAWYCIVESKLIMLTKLSSQIWHNAINLFLCLHEKCWLRVNNLRRICQILSSNNMADQNRLKIKCNVPTKTWGKLNDEKTEVKMMWYSPFKRSLSGTVYNICSIYSKVSNTFVNDTQPLYRIFW